MTGVALMVNAVAAALNAALYADAGNPIHLGVAVLCTLVCLANIAAIASGR